MPTQDDASSIQIRRQGKIAVISFRAGDAKCQRGDVFELRQQVLELAEKSPDPKFVVDFSGVGYVASDVLGLLVETLLMLRQKGGDLRLTGICEGLKDLFRLTSLDSVFQISPDQPSAIKSLEPSAE